MKIRTDGKEFSGSLYQKIAHNLESAITISCASADNTPNFNIGCLYRMDEDTQIKVSHVHSQCESI